MLYNTSPPKRGGRQYPETLALEVGKEVVAIALDQRVADTCYGEREVVEVVVRGKPESQLFTLWWPRGLPKPPAQTPFVLRRESKRGFILLVAESDEESKALWRDGSVCDVADEGMKSLIPPKFRA